MSLTPTTALSEGRSSPASRLMPNVVLHKPTQPLSESDALCAAGMAQLYPTSGKVNVIEAINLLQRSASLKHPVAMTHLGKIYQSGRYIEQDLSLAASYYKDAAECGHGPAAYFFAEMALAGEGMDVSPQLADKYFLKAQEFGYQNPVPADRNRGLILGPRKDRFTPPRLT